MAAEKQSEDKQNAASPIAELHDKRVTPEGVVSKQSQTYMIVALALLILLAVLFSNKRVKDATPLPVPIANAAPAETTQHNVQQLRGDLTETQKQVQEQIRKDEQAHTDKVAADNGNAQQGATNHTASGPETEPHRDPIADAERALKFKSRFASNLVATNETIPVARAQAASPADDTDKTISDSTLPTGAVSRSGSLQNVLTQNGTAKHSVEINVNSAFGQPYALFEGTTIDTVLVNRLNGDFSGPVKAMVTNPVYSQDRQHVLIPEGTFILGEVQKVSGLGQRRLAVMFHRMIMPDGYSVDLDQFHGLDAAGETGLADQVNNHYLQSFGTSIALGVIAGTAEATTNTGFTQSGSDLVRQGMASSIAQSGAHVLDRFLNILPTVTIREGHRIKVYLTGDLLLPAYENHAMPGNL